MGIDPTHIQVVLSEIRKGGGGQVADLLEATAREVGLLPGKDAPPEFYELSWCPACGDVTTDNRTWHDDCGVRTKHFTVRRVTEPR